MGLYALFQRRAGALAARVLINTMFWTIVAYFIWHSLHARVEANWFAPVYPAFAIAAAGRRPSRAMGAAPAAHRSISACAGRRRPAS